MSEGSQMGLSVGVKEVEESGGGEGGSRSIASCVLGRVEASGMGVERDGRGGGRCGGEWMERCRLTAGGRVEFGAELGASCRRLVVELRVDGAVSV